MKTAENCKKPDDFPCTPPTVCTTLSDMKTPENPPETARPDPQKREISQAEINSRLKVPFSQRMHADLYIQGPASWQDGHANGSRISGECGQACSGCQSSSGGGCGSVGRNMEGGA